MNFMRRGVTLMELVVVIGVLVVLGTLVIPAVTDSLGQSRDDVTWQSMRRVRDLVMGTYWDDMYEQLPRPMASTARADHPQMCFLFVNPETYEDGDTLTADYDTTYDPISRRGWRGPYLLHQGAGHEYEVDTAAGFKSRYGEDGDPAVLDGWGHPIVIQEPDENGDDFVDADEARHVRLVSAGPDGVIDTAADTLLPTDRGDDLVLFLRIAE